MFDKIKNTLIQLLSKKKGLQHYADCIIRNEKGEVLLLQRSYNDDFEPGKWCLPGGKIEPGEAPEYGAARELLEETHLQTVLNFLQVVERPDSVTCYFEGFVHSQTYTILDNEEHFKVEWVPVDKIAQYDLLLDLKNILVDKIGLPIYSTKLMELQIFDANDLFKRNELVEKSFDNEEMTTADYFSCKKIINNHLSQIVKVGFEKGIFDDLDLEKGGKKAFIGEIRTFAGREHIRTIDGWKYYGKGTGTKAKEHSKDDIKKTDLRVIHKLSELSDSELDSLHATAVIDSKKKDFTGWDTIKDIVEEKSLRAAIASKKSEKSTIKFPSYDSLDHSSSVSAGGSGGAYLISHKTDGKFIVKKEEKSGDKNSSDQLRSEHLTDKLYKTLGINASQSELQITKDGVVKIAKFIDPSKTLASFLSDYKKDPKVVDSIKQSIQKGFVADCLLMNWDVIGQGQDNIIVTADKDGSGFATHRIDNGGALLFRAKKGKKSSDAFTSEVAELNTLRSSKNAVAQQIFGSITDEEIKKQVQHIVANRKQLLDTIDQSDVADQKQIHTLIGKRIDWLEQKWITEDRPKEEKSSKPATSTVNITEKYLQELDTLEFQGNKDIKQAISEQIQSVEKYHQAAYSKHATKRGISINEYKGLLQKHVEKLVAESSFFRATDASILSNVITEGGRYKSQFETGTSGGSLSPDNRARVEDIFFKFGNKKQNKEMRPIYGYISDNTNGIMNEVGDHPPRNRTSQYGAVTIKLNDKVRSKTTICFCDSLGASSNIACTPANKPHFTSLRINTSVDPLDAIAKTSKASDYVEAQYHSQLTAEDIESVHISAYNFTHAANPGADTYEKLNDIIEIIGKTNKKIKVYGKS